MVHAKLTLTYNDNEVFDLDIRLNSNDDYELEVARLWQRYLGVALSGTRGQLPSPPPSTRVGMVNTLRRVTLPPTPPEVIEPDVKVPSK